MTRVSEGSVHGRFQPLHNEHLRYILAAKEQCEFLWVGLTQYETSPDNLNPLGAHRERPENNPLSYYERVVLITDALLDSGVTHSEFGVVPFPIETPEHLGGFLPKSVTCYTTICEEWNREKIRLLQAYGYRVEVLWTKIPKQLSAAEIRTGITSGDSSWEDKVPPATIRAVKKFDLRSRLRELRDPAP